MVLDEYSVINDVFVLNGYNNIGIICNKNDELILPEYIHNFFSTIPNLLISDNLSFTSFIEISGNLSFELIDNDIFTFSNDTQSYNLVYLLILRILIHINQFKYQYYLKMIILEFINVIYW